MDGDPRLSPGVAFAKPLAMPIFFPLRTALGICSLFLGAVDAKGEVMPFHGSTERGLLVARAKIAAAQHQLRLRRYALAERNLQDGLAGLEDAFDRIDGIAEIREAWLRLAEAALRARHPREAEHAAEAVARLSPEGLTTSNVASPRLLALLEEARRRVKDGPWGTLHVTSVIRGQVVYIDGAPRGRTPERLDLPIGRHFLMIETPLGRIPYRVDLGEGEGLRVGQGDTDEVHPEEDWDLPREQAAETRAARRPVLPHRR
jgi:hypothetical protein